MSIANSWLGATSLASAMQPGIPLGVRWVLGGFTDERRGVI
jgi:hypothetical protein